MVGIGKWQHRGTAIRSDHFKHRGPAFHVIRFRQPFRIGDHREGSKIGWETHRKRITSNRG